MIKITAPNTAQIKRELANLIDEIVTDEVVTVGIHESESARDDPGSLTNAQLGAIHEFGTPTIPARPWLVPGVESGNKEYIETVKHEMEAGRQPEDILPVLGVIAVSSVQQYMTALRSPPNAQSTINKKGSSNPLIDTGELKSSVTFEIRQKGE